MLPNGPSMWHKSFLPPLCDFTVDKPRSECHTNSFLGVVSFVRSLAFSSGSTGYEPSRCVEEPPAHGSHRVWRNSFLSPSQAFVVVSLSLCLLLPFSLRVLTPLPLGAVLSVNILPTSVVRRILGVHRGKERAERHYASFQGYWDPPKTVQPPGLGVPLRGFCGHKV